MAIFHPGYMSHDSIEQLTEARSGIFAGWHPPLMGYVWGFLDRIVPGPFGMVLLHNLMFWGGLGLLIHLSVSSSLVGPLLVLSIGCLPPILALLGTVWKDVGLGAALLLAFALLLHAERRNCRTSLILALLPLFYGTAVRHNAGAAVLPISLWAGDILRRQVFPNSSKKAGLTALLGLILFIVVGLLAVLANAALRNGRNSFPVQQILIHDLTAISISTHKIFLPEYLVNESSKLSIADLERAYSPFSVVPLIFGEGTQPPLRITREPVEFRQLAGKWREVIPQNLGAYVSHRVHVFRCQLGIYKEEVFYPFHQGVDANALGVSFQRSALNLWVMTFLIGVKNSLFFRGWFHAVLILASLGLSLSRRGMPVASVALGLSGLSYLASYLLVSPASDFRLIWWTVVCAMIFPVLILSQELRRPITSVEN